jgi:hypothetical protein
MLRREPHKPRKFGDAARYIPKIRKSPDLIPVFSVNCDRERQDEVRVGTCGQARTALYFANPPARDRCTKPPAASRPDGDDRWRKGGPDGPLPMSGFLQGRTLSRAARS